MCAGIIRNNSLVGGRARAESNPGHWARHALLHMAAECVNHSAMEAGPTFGSHYSRLPDLQTQPTQTMSLQVFASDNDVYDYLYVYQIALMNIYICQMALCQWHLDQNTV